MEKSANYFLTGIFVLAALVALTGFSIWLASPRDTNEYERYTVHFTTSVSGLEEGAGVRYKGVPVGKVERIRLTEGKPDLIKVDIAVDEKTPVRAHTKAMLDMRGIAGLVYLELSTEPDDKEMPPVPKGEIFPVLIGSASPVAAILENMGEFSEDGFGEIKAATGEIKHAATSIRMLADQLREDPSQVIRGPKKNRKPRPQRME